MIFTPILTLAMLFATPPSQSFAGLVDDYHAAYEVHQRAKWDRDHKAKLIRKALERAGHPLDVPGGRPVTVHRYSLDGDGFRVDEVPK